MGSAADVDKPRRPGSGFELERPREEGSHLSTGDGVPRTVTRRTGPATCGNTQISKAIHERCPPHGGIHICETRRTRRGRIRTIEDPHQPHRHHPPLQRFPGTEPAWRALGTLEDTVTGERLDGFEVTARLCRVRKPTWSNS